jgi:GDPmannose 4,6-dehydratase
MKRVVIVGSGGQDGRLLEQRLHAEGCEVVGIRRDGPGPDLTQREQVAAAMRQWQPAEVYYLAAYHHSSQEKTAADPAAIFTRSFEVHVTGLVHYLDAIRLHSPASRLFYAASSLVFGDPPSPVQTEATPFSPRCPYGISKAAGVHVCRHFRETHRVFASAGILYNHESPLRQEKFVSQKIVQAALRIARGEQDKLTLGDLSARIDWGYAPDFVDAMTRLLALPESGDFIVATGETHSVQEFVEIAFDRLGLDWRAHVLEDPALLGRRKASMTGDASKLRQLTGWQPTVDFPGMIAALLPNERHAG